MDVTYLTYIFGFHYERSTLGTHMAKTYTLSYKVLNVHELCLA